MKKMICVVVLAALLMSGCTGLNVNTAINASADIAFVTILKNNPQYKPAVVTGLKEVKIVLNNDITYDQLLVELNKRFGGDYALIGAILVGYFNNDKPLFETYLPMLESYKTDINKKIDQWIVLASL